MKTISLLFIISLFINVKTEIVSVNDGGSVTLHTDLIDLKREDVIMWRFNGDRIAKINIEANDTPVYYDKRFTDKLEMNSQTEDLTITNITSELTGEYQLEINGVTTKTFIVSLSPKVKKGIAEIITENGEISTPFIVERFRGRLMLDEETGDVIIINMRKEDYEDYEADVKHTVHKAISYADIASARFSNDEGKDDGSSTDLSSGQITGIIVAVAIAAIAAVAAVVVAAAAVVVVIFKMKRLQETIAADVIFIKKRRQDLNGETDKYTYGNCGTTDNKTALIQVDPVYVLHSPGPENPESGDQNGQYETV